MTPKERAAMQQALEALVYHTEQTRPIHSTNEAITALREALAEQAEQEPVAWVWLDDWLNDGYPEDCFSRVNHQNKTPLYAAPFRAKDLTDDEMEELCRKYARFELIREAIAKYKEKNK